jgi:hypothetical protein
MTLDDNQINDLWYIVVYRDEFAMENDIDEPIFMHYPDCVVKVYSSTGNIVFSSVGYEQEWDGKLNGEKVDPGTYYYVIEPGKGKDPITGSLTIIY